MLALDNITTSQDYDYYELPIPTQDIQAEVLQGLAEAQKTLSPKYFYDRLGSELFDQITELPEYYQTRTELKILRDYASEIGNYLNNTTALIEYGSGNTEKLRALLEIAVPQDYIPVEISKSHLQKFSQDLATDYPQMKIHAIRADYGRPWQLPEAINNPNKLAYFAGSSLGNFTPEESVQFLRQVHRHVGTQGGLLIGIDNKKDSPTLNQAYNDRQGVTAKFNLNVLSHINSLINSRFNTDKFQHLAFYNEAKGRIEMHLKSMQQQTIRIAEKLIKLEPGETIHTENSYKYSSAEFSNLAQQAGFSIKEHWQDNEKLFSIYYLN